MTKAELLVAADRAHTYPPGNGDYFLEKTDDVLEAAFEGCDELDGKAINEELGASGPVAELLNEYPYLAQFG